MSKIYVDTVEPSAPTKNITLGATGDSITVGGTSINTNIIQDSGGNVLFQSDGSGTLSNVNSAFSADLKLLRTQTASGSSSISFTSDIDSTYDLYIFKFIEINPATDTVDFKFQGSTNGGSGYGVTKTTTAFWAAHAETDASEFEYRTNQDLAQSTDAQWLNVYLGNGADENASGELYLYAPSSTTYVKHFYSTVYYYQNNNYSTEFFVSGYFNTTSAINAMQFTMSSGNFDGVIKMYGL